MVKLIIRFVGVLYGITGLIFLAPFIGIIAALRGIIESPATYLTIFLVKVFPLIISGLLCYSFLTFKKWGRYLAIIYNSVCVAVLISDLISMLGTPYIRAHLEFGLPGIFVFGILTVFILLKPVRDVMQ